MIICLGNLGSLRASDYAFKRIAFELVFYGDGVDDNGVVKSIEPEFSL